MSSQSLINITSQLLKNNFMFPVVSILGLTLFTYLIKRYLDTEKKTNNQYYIKTDEQLSVIPNITLTTTSGLNNIIYIFWNGDLNSTYLLIDLLSQEKIVQPLYVERYTILKSLEYDNLEKMTKHYISIKNTSNINTPVNKKIKQYLEDIAKIKHNQNNETSQLTLFRKIIIKQYPEFQSNFLPTQYITTITKDLEYTSEFFNILKTLNPIHYNGIEFLEQILRFIKHFNMSQKKTSSRILIGYSKDSKNIELIKNIKNILNTNNITSQNNNNLEMPLQDITNKDISYLSINIFPNNMYFTTLHI
jgi:hypothetical protein